MNVSEALEELLAERNIVVGDTTFEIETLDHIKLDTGDDVYFVRDGGDLWLSVDSASDEIILFNNVEEEFDFEAEVIVYNGEDYEFSLESEGSVLVDGEELDKITFRDYEGPYGRILRIIQYSMSGEVVNAVGKVVPEEQLQKI